MTDFTFIIPSHTQLLAAAGILLAAWLVSVFVMMVFKRSKFLTSQTTTTLDDTIIRLVGRPVHVGFQLIGIVLALNYLFPEMVYQGFGFSELIPILLIMWGAYTLDRVILGIVEWHEIEARNDGPGGLEHESFGFLNTIISMLIWGVALAFILNQVGVDISALIAGLGIAGIAVALALQNTLSGLFSAVGLAMDKPVRPGDFIQLEDGTEGFVQDISMRSTRIKTFQNTLVIIPNKRLADMVITNTFMPGAGFSLKVSVGVDYGADLDQAEKITLAVAAEVLERLDVMGENEPVVRFGGFDSSSIEMKVFMHVAGYMDQFVVKHEFIKALKVAFEKEKIGIPYPQMEVHLEK
jgi:small-conductance mechanosensitive channel